MKRALASALLWCALGSAASPALAGGIETPENGSIAMGRAGAFTARASDPTALMLNVAGLVGVEGLQVTLSGNLAAMEHCFQRQGAYPERDAMGFDESGTVFSQSAYADGRTPYPRVCNRPVWNPAPQVLASYRLSPRLAVGVGIYGPNTTGAGQVFDDRVTLSNGSLAPSPVRHMVFEKALLLFHVPLAVAWAPTPWLRVGAAFEPSYADFTLATMVNVGGAQLAQSPSFDAVNRLNTRGFFVAGNLGVQVLPSPFLSLGFHAHLTAAPDLSGTSDVVVNHYAARPQDRVASQYRVDSMVVPMPHTFRAGARFSLPRAGRPRQGDARTGARYDPMTDDVFDVELDFSYETTARMAAITLKNSGEIDIGGTRVPAPREVSIRSDFSDSWGLRLGGDVNVLPGVLALRAGVAYEHGAVSNEWAQIHLAAYDSVSLHAGASVRWRWFTFSAAFARFIMADFEADRGLRSVIGTTGALSPMQCNLAGADACSLNRGVYQSALTVLNLGVTARF